jgi:hypothetical protein
VLDYLKGFIHIDRQTPNLIEYLVGMVEIVTKRVVTCSEYLAKFGHKPPDNIIDRIAMI